MLLDALAVPPAGHAALATLLRTRGQRGGQHRQKTQLTRNPQPTNTYNMLYNLFVIPTQSSHPFKIPGDILGVETAMPPIRLAAEILEVLREATAVEEEAKPPLQLAFIRNQRPALRPCSGLGHIFARIDEQLGRRWVVVLPIPLQAAQHPLVALVDAPQADGEHDGPALRGDLNKRSAGGV